MRDFPEAPFQPPESIPRCCCAWCGEEIYAGERIYRGDEGAIHPACILPLMEETLGVDYLASLCGYQEELA